MYLWIKPKRECVFTNFIDTFAGIHSTIGNCCHFFRNRNKRMADTALLLDWSNTDRNALGNVHLIEVTNIPSLLASLNVLVQLLLVGGGKTIKFLWGNETRCQSIKWNSPCPQCAWHFDLLRNRLAVAEHPLYKNCSQFPVAALKVHMGIGGSVQSSPGGKIGGNWQISSE